MLKQRARVLASGLLLGDLALTAASFVLAHALRGGLFRALWPSVFAAPLYPLTRYLPLLAVILPIWTACLFSAGFYRSRRTRKRHHAARTTFSVWRVQSFSIFLLR